MCFSSKTASGWETWHTLIYAVDSQHVWYVAVSYPNTFGFFLLLFFWEYLYFSHPQHMQTFHFLEDSIGHKFITTWWSGALEKKTLKMNLQFKIWRKETSPKGDLVFKFPAALQAFLLVMAKHAVSSALSNRITECLGFGRDLWRSSHSKTSAEGREISRGRKG